MTLHKLIHMYLISEYQDTKNKYIFHRTYPQNCDSCYRNNICDISIKLKQDMIDLEKLIEEHNKFI